MAQLMAIPLEDDGDAVLIVARHADAALMGYVRTTALAGLDGRPSSTHECLAFVHRHLDLFERILQQKTTTGRFADDRIACVEIDAGDLLRGGVPGAYEAARRACADAAVLT